MNPNYYPFKVGAFECISVRDGYYEYPPANFFSNAPPDEIEAALRARDLPTDKVVTPYTCLYVHAGDHRVMIDVGAGPLSPSAGQLVTNPRAAGVDSASIDVGAGSLMPTAGQLVTNLRAAGVDPASIDTVIVTHAHPDHIGGNLDQDGTSLFPNANYFIWKSEWEFWSSDPGDAPVPEFFFKLAREQLGPVQDRMTLLDGEREIVPGIRALATPGHTPGHMAVLITSEGEQLLHISDVVLYPLHLEHPDWLPVYDILPEQAAESKVRTMNRIADEQMLMFAHHFPPFPNLGHVARQGDGWVWQAIELAG
jgi:glyoxylase-like metal-dependent hydrolase (beta-lactamase superfamily II)